MIHLTSGPALLVELGLAVFCLVDALLAPEAAVRWLPRWGWALALLVFPLCAVILWLVAGHPWRAKARAETPETFDADTFETAAPAATTSLAPPSQWYVTAPVAPRPPSEGASTDAVLARQLLELHAEQEQTLQLWEADLRRREAALREAQTRTGATPETA